MAKFLTIDKFGQIRSYKKNFLLANKIIEIVLKIPFFPCSNININFTKVKKLTGRNYIVAKALPNS